MPTAIMPLYTHQGFVMGADRSRRGSDTGQNVDNFQKIFSVPGEKLAYALAGSVGITPEGAKEIVFDFREATRASAASIPAGSTKSTREYATQLSIRVHARMCHAVSEANRQGLKTPYPADSPYGNTGFVIAILFLMGYCNNTPGFEQVVFWHKNEKASVDAPYSSLKQGYPRESWAGYGSMEIFNRLYVSEDARFADFIGPKPANLDNLTLSEAVEVANRYVLASQTPLARQLDAKTCTAIGGHPVIATVTLSEGFEWAKGFEPPEGNQAF